MGDLGVDDFGSKHGGLTFSSNDGGAQSDIGCDHADVEQLIAGKQTTPPAPVGISPRKAISESKRLFGDEMLARCHQCHKHINCFNFSLTFRDRVFHLVSPC